MLMLFEVLNRILPNRTAFLDRNELIIDKDEWKFPGAVMNFQKLRRHGLIFQALSGSDDLAVDHNHPRGVER